MIKVICDRCGEEVNTNSGIFTFEYACHINPINNTTYITPYGLNVSWRQEKHDVCLACYNAIYEAAFAVFQNYKSEDNGVK